MVSVVQKVGVYDFLLSDRKMPQNAVLRLACFLCLILSSKKRLA